MQKKISIIIPVYDTEKYLEKCLNSVIHQTYKNIEILIIYKKSQDDSLNIIKSFIKKDKRIKLFFQDDGGLGGARNIGIDNSSGDYIFFLDSDDWICLKALELLLNKIENDNSDLIMFPFFSFDDSKGIVIKNAWGSQLNFNKKIMNKSFVYKDLTPIEFISENAIVVAWNKLYRKEFIKKYNLKFPENLRYEDNPFYYKSIILANSISVLNKKLLYYRINRDNSLQSSDYDSKSVLDIITIMKMIENDIVENKLPSSYYQQFETYMYSEFLWRFRLLRKNKLLFLKSIKNNFSNDQFENLLNKINFKTYVEEKEINNNKISIIIPVYNVEKYISYCLDSVINQTLKDIEIILIDDCSTDNSNNIMVNYALFDNRIKIFYNDTNMGAGFSKNVGLKNSNGKYIMFLDPDDLYYSQDTIKNLYEVISKHNVALACGNIGVIPDNYENNHVITKYNGYNIKEEGYLTFSDYNVWPSWGFTRFIYESDFLKKEGILFPNYKNYEDPIFLVNVLSKVQKFWGVPYVVYLYRQTIKQKKVTLRKIEDTLNSVIEILKVYKSRNLSNHYSFEYMHLINYISSDIKPYIKKHKNQSKNIINQVNNILDNIDEKLILNNIKVYKNFQDIKSPNFVRKAFAKVFYFFRKVYSLLEKK